MVRGSFFCGKDGDQMRRRLFWWEVGGFAAVAVLAVCAGLCVWGKVA